MATPVGKMTRHVDIECRCRTLVRGPVFAPTRRAFLELISGWVTCTKTQNDRNFGSPRRVFNLVFQLRGTIACSKNGDFWARKSVLREIHSRPIFDLVVLQRLGNPTPKNGAVQNSLRQVRDSRRAWHKSSCKRSVSRSAQNLGEIAIDMHSLTAGQKELMNSGAISATLPHILPIATGN